LLTACLRKVSKLAAFTNDAMSQRKTLLEFYLQQGNHAKNQEPEKQPALLQ